ncbi:TonB-dependent receptor [Alteromonadaceae bacterium Bs31]|nr:TonB-dependent receptor [Alteromonadaceae bacterium Bs31]
MISTTEALLHQSPERLFSKKPLAKHIACLLSGISLSLMTGNALAQTETSAGTPDPDVPEEAIVEEVFVTGIRASQRGAIDLRREAGTMVDAIIAEDVSQFPDKNIAEALQRIPGVQMTRDFGEGRGVNIRGVEQGLVRTEVDGVTALGSDSSRTVDFSLLASELVKVLKVVKGSEARITEGGIGGTIQIEMRRANDFDDHFFSAALESEYNDLSETSSPKANVTGVYKITDSLGVMANVTYSNKTTMIHALRNTYWDRWADYDNSPEKSVVDPNYADANSAEDCVAAYGVNGSNNAEDLRECERQWWDFTPKTPRYGIWSREDSRISSNFALGWEVNDYLSTFVDYTYNEKDREALDLNLHLESGSALRMDPNSVVVDNEHNVRAFTTADAELMNRTLNFDWVQRSELAKIGFDFSREAWDISGIAAHSSSYQDIDSRDTRITQKGVAGVRVTLDERGAPEFDLGSGYRYQNPKSPNPGDFQLISVNDPASYNGRARYKYAPVNQEQEESSVKFDVSYNFDDFFVTRLHTGARWARQYMEDLNSEVNIIRDVGTEYALLDANGDPVLDNDGRPVFEEWTVEDQYEVVNGATFQTPELFNGFDLGVKTVGTWQAADTGILIDRLTAIDGTTVDRNQLPPRPGALEVEETVASVYLQADFEHYFNSDTRLSGNLGVRYAETETSSVGDVKITAKVDQFETDDDGNLILDDDGRPIVATDEFGSPLSAVDVPVYDGRDESQGKYSDVLPSINLNLDILDSYNIYAHWSEVMARPTIEELNIDANCTIWATERSQQEMRANTCTAGNPDLEPYRANQYELAFSWYPNDDSLVSVAYFVKELTSYLGPEQTFDDKELFAGGENAGIVYDVKQKTNITGVTTSGVEFQARTVFDFLPAPFNNMGGEFNYTVMDASDVPHKSGLDGSDLPWLEQSKNSFNIGAFYEDENLAIRLAYSYRDRYLKETADDSDAPVYVDESGHLDSKITYTFGDSGFAIFADARNLTDEVYLESTGSSRLSDLQWSGRTFAIGGSFKY